MKILYKFIIIILSVMNFNSIVHAAVEARYVKVLIDKGSGGIYNGAISISELSIIDNSGNNLSISATASASSYYGIRYPAKAIDDSYSSVYATSDGTGLSPFGNEWFLVDLGSVKQISSIILSTSLLYNSASLTDYRILVSKDNLSFESVVIKTGLSPVTRTDTHLMSQSPATTFQNFYYQLQLPSATAQDLAITFAIFWGLIVSVGMLSLFGGLIVRMVFPSYSAIRRDYY